MADMHLGAMQLSLTAENWSGSVTIRSAIDGRVVNAGAKLYRRFNGKHLEPLADETVGNDGVCLVVRTSQSHVHVAQVARTQFFLDGRQLEVQRQVIKEPNYIGQELTIGDFRVRVGGPQSHGARRPLHAVKADHVLAWAHLWRRFDVRIEPAEPGFKLNVPMLLRLNMCERRNIGLVDREVARAAMSRRATDRICRSGEHRAQPSYSLIGRTAIAKKSGSIEGSAEADADFVDVLGAQIRGLIFENFSTGQHRPADFLDGHADLIERHVRGWYRPVFGDPGRYEAAGSSRPVSLIVVLLSAHRSKAGVFSTTLIIAELKSSGTRKPPVASVFSPAARVRSGIFLRASHCFEASTSHSPFR
jgi:hypothetical protein